ncbi:NAD-dependent epimerase/dehydratase family protein [Crocinitomicaceae bacterium CZZ-1]|uniref:NAD-dependent epimerase/dehydratase family protein n=1 Tax=Taishania pollutisoli TaxID=2766479 RepID=A0A8J6TZ80_9FLAO|nr:NAD-dependent epimerase/dehydratase family protein [Taishania pollutisoli]MBC9811798.1 NAD-dependent epimerase/dehydratase family protein [Taishania pollutisoli]MBX2948267.1 NAD-dependent epimerase/dehydratase family protein [Crocinitomicaceae bacterium]NGF75365.1 NAD-dependent epimerase/dehydratase family protein [Fluviicola sp. SGL-29]
MKILVTGSTGFIGEGVVSELLKEGHEVIATSRNEHTASFHDWFSSVHYKPYTIGSKDISDLYAYFEKPQAVIHCAWDNLHDYRGLHHVEENLMNHYFFLKSIIESGVENVTVLGTCFEYGMKEGCLSETMNVTPSNPYGIGKNTLRVFLEMLQSVHDFSLKWIRLFYNYGKSNNSNSLFAQLDRAIAQHDSVFNMSDGNQLRDYLLFDELVKKIAAISVQDRISGIINCCSGKPVRVIELVEEYIRIKNSPIQLNRGYYNYSPMEPVHFWGDNTKLNTI